MDPSHVAYPDVGIQHGIQVRICLSWGSTQFGHDYNEGKETNHSNQQQHEDSLFQCEGLFLSASTIPKKNE